MKTIEQKDLFLCHSKTDVEWVRKLATSLEKEQWQDRRLRVAFDEWDVQLGKNVVLELSRLLEHSRFVGVVLSPELVTSEFCTFEWTSAVYSDPAGVRGRVIPIILRHLDKMGTTRLEIPLALRNSNRLDFSRPGNYKREYSRLLCRLRNEPLPRGRGATKISTPSSVPITAGLPVAQETPDPVEEVLLSNLLPVVSYPGTVWSAPTHARKQQDIWNAIPQSEDRANTPPFILKDERLYTFADLTSLAGPLRAFITRSGIASDAAGRWRQDPAKWRWYVELLYRSLKRHAIQACNLYYDPKNKRFFFPPYHGKARLFNFTLQTRPRTVAKPCTRLNGEVFWVHQGSKLRFETLKNRVYLAIIPAWVFTTDGHHVLEGPNVGPLSTKWSSKERNGAILRHVLFWSSVLAGRKRQIDINTGGEPLIIGRDPTRTLSPVGVAFDFIGVRALVSSEDDDLALAEGIATDAPGGDDDTDEAD